MEKLIRESRRLEMMCLKKQTNISAPAQNIIKVPRLTIGGGNTSLFI